MNPKQEFLLNIIFILVMILGVQIIHASTLIN